MNVSQTIDEILRSAEFRRSLESAVRSVGTACNSTETASVPCSSQSTSSGTRQNSSSVCDELNRLFPSIANRNRNTRKRLVNINTTHSRVREFHKEVFLIPFKDCRSTLKGKKSRRIRK